MIYFAIPGGLLAGLVVVLMVTRRRRDGHNGLMRLGTVSSRWLIEHRGGH